MHYFLNTTLRRCVPVTVFRYLQHSRSLWHSTKSKFAKKLTHKYSIFSKFSTFTEKIIVDVFLGNRPRWFRKWPLKISTSSRILSTTPLITEWPDYEQLFAQLQFFASDLCCQILAQKQQVLDSCFETTDEKSVSWFTVSNQLRQVDVSWFTGSKQWIGRTVSWFFGSNQYWTKVVSWFFDLKQQWNWITCFQLFSLPSSVINSSA